MWFLLEIILIYVMCNMREYKPPWHGLRSYAFKYIMPFISDRLAHIYYRFHMSVTKIFYLKVAEGDPRGTLCHHAKLAKREKRSVHTSGDHEGGASHVDRSNARRSARHVAALWGHPSRASLSLSINPARPHLQLERARGSVHVTSGALERTPDVTC